LSLEGYTGVLLELTKLFSKFNSDSIKEDKGFVCVHAQLCKSVPMGARKKQS
jgi:hypothetical protein